MPLPLASAWVARPGPGHVQPVSPGESVVQSWDRGLKVLQHMCRQHVGAEGAAAHVLPACCLPSGVQGCEPEHARV